MDNTLPNQQQEPIQQMPQPEKKGFLKALALLEVGLIELFFVGIVLIFLFGTLNYFNILRLSDLFPNQLGFLPHQREVPTGTSQFNNSAMKQLNNITIPTITATNIVPESAKIETKSLIEDIILSSIIPSNLAFSKQDVKNPYNYTFYGTGWEGKNGESFVITVEYNEKKIFIDRQIAIHIPKVINNLDASVSSSIIKDYMILIPSSQFSCTPLPLKDFKTIFCESFWEDTNGIKKGIDVKSPVRNLNETQIFYCEHHEGTPAYNWKSCNPNFKDTGIL